MRFCGKLGLHERNDWRVHQVRQIMDSSNNNLLHTAVIISLESTFISQDLPVGNSAYDYSKDEQVSR